MKKSLLIIGGALIVSSALCPDSSEQKPPLAIESPTVDSESEDTKNDSDQKSIKKVSVQPAKKSEEKKIQTESISNLTTFEDAVKSAIENSSGYAMSKIDRAIAGLQLINARMMVLPNIELSGSTSSVKEKDKYTGNENETIKRKNLVHWEAAITQNLFNGFSTMNNATAKAEEDEAGKWKLESATQNLIYNVLEATVNLWYTIEDFKSAQMKQANLLLELEAQKSSFIAGTSTSFDVAKAEANHEQSVYETHVSEAKMRAAEAEFAKTAAMVPTENVELPDFSKIFPNDLEEIKKISLASNPDIISAKRAEKAALYALSATRGKLAPRIDLIAKVSTNLDRYHTSDTDHRGRSKSIGIQCSIPIFSNNTSSGNTHSEIAIAEEQAKKASFQVRDQANVIKKECAVSYHNYETSEFLIKSSLAALKSAEIGASGDRQESALGLKSNTETLVRENQLHDSRKSLAQSKAQLVLAKGKILRMMGVLTLESIFGEKKLLKKFDIDNIIKPSNNKKNKQEQK